MLTYMAGYRPVKVYMVLSQGCNREHQSCKVATASAKVATAKLQSCDGNGSGCQGHCAVHIVFHTDDMFQMLSLPYVHKSTWCEGGTNVIIREIFALIMNKIFI